MIVIMLRGFFGWMQKPHLAIGYDPRYDETSAKKFYQSIKRNEAYASSRFTRLKMFLIASLKNPEIKTNFTHELNDSDLWFVWHVKYHFDH